MRALLLAGLTLAACGGEDPGGLALEIGPSPVAATGLAVSVRGPAGPLVEGQRFGAPPGVIRIAASGRSDLVRIAVYALAGEERVAFGAAAVDLAAGARTVEVPLAAPLPLDVDADGWPDPVDDHLDTVAPQTPFPPEGACDALVRRGGPEHRPANATANATVPSAPTLPDWGAGDRRANTDVKPRIRGQFTGTTDEILQWAACRWGMDEDLARAFAATVSEWRQTAESGGSYGLFGINPMYASGTLPWARDSTAFNADYGLGWWRACYEGYWTWIEQPQPGSGYAQGDALGCTGMWASGRWYDAPARGFIGSVEAALRDRPWERPGF